MANTLRDVREIFAQAEVDLLQLISELSPMTAPGSRAHYRRQLDRVIILRKEADRILTAMNGQAMESLQADLLQEWRRASLKAMESAPLPAGQVIPEFVDPAPAIQIAKSATGSLARASRTILRTVDDAYRDVVSGVTASGIASGATNRKLLQQALDRLAARGLTAFVDSSGRRWSMGSYADMAVRTARSRANNEARRAGYQAAGWNFIHVSSHRGCSPQCMPFQGKILSLDGRVGDIEHVAPNGDKHIVHVTAGFDDAVNRGYHHPNCRHTDTAYIPGNSVPPGMKTSEADYKAEQLQRHHERKIREWKRREAVATTPHDKARARAKVREWQKIQREHLKRHGWLSRKYDREQLRIGNAANGSLPTPRPAPEPVLSAPAPLKLPSSWAKKTDPVNKIDGATWGKATKRLATLKKGGSGYEVAWAQVIAAGDGPGGQALVKAKARARAYLDAEARLRYYTSASKGNAFLPVRSTADVKDMLPALKETVKQQRAAFHEQLVDMLGYKENLLYQPTKEGAAAVSGYLKTAKFSSANKLASYKKPYSLPAAEQWARNVLSKHSLGEQAYMSETVMAARNMLSALRAEQAAKFLDEVEGAALKADVKANLKAAKQRMMVAVKADVDEGMLAKFLEGKGATDKTVQAFGAELKMVRKAQAAVKKGKPKGMPVTAAGAREPGVRAKGPIGHIPLTKKIMEDEVLGYMADLRTAGYLVDLDQVAKAYARVHGMDNRQVEYLAGQIATARYGGGPKSVSLQDEIRDLLGKKQRHVVGDDGKLVRAKDDRFTEFYEGILNGETPNSGRAWAEAISLWEKEAYDKRIESVRTYTGNAYRSINNAERKSKGKRAWKKKVRDDIDSLMDEVPRPKQRVEVYRGTTSAQFETTSLRGVEIKDPYEWVGEEFIEYGYMSTSVESKSAFGGQIRMHLELPPDAKGMYVSYGRGGGGTAISKYAHENELILARQTCFKVMKVEPRGNGYEVWAKVTEQRV